MEGMIRAILIGAAAVALVAFGLFMSWQEPAPAELPSVAEEIATDPAANGDRGAARKRAIMTTAAIRKGRKVQARLDKPIRSEAAEPIKAEGE